MEHLDQAGSSVLWFPHVGGSPLTTTVQKEKQMASFFTLLCPPDLMFFAPVTWVDLKQADKIPWVNQSVNYVTTLPLGLITGAL